MAPALGALLLMLQCGQQGSEPVCARAAEHCRRGQVSACHAASKVWGRPPCCRKWDSAANWHSVRLCLASKLCCSGCRTGRETVSKNICPRASEQADHAIHKLQSSRHVQQTQLDALVWGWSSCCRVSRQTAVAQDVQGSRAAPAASQQRLDWYATASVGTCVTA